MKIYVGNLSYQLTEELLRSTFEEFGGVVSASIVKDKMTGRSRGFGFVEMESADAGHQAVTKLNGSELEGRRLMVSEARPRQESDRPQRSRSSFRSNNNYRDR